MHPSHADSLVVDWITRLRLENKEKYVLQLKKSPPLSAAHVHFGGIFLGRKRHG
jgi:hypothetical protein